MVKMLWSLISILLWISPAHGEVLCNPALDKRYFEKLQYNLVDGLPDICITPFTEMIGITWKNGVVYDKPLIQKFYSLLAAHDHFFVAIDLGAQTGSFSLLAKFFPNSRWYAFEPLQEAAETLKINLFLNDIPNVSVYQLAASYSSGWATLQMPDRNEWGLATLGSNVLRFTPTSERKVQCIDLDSFIKENHIEKVDFIKIDTEGSELFILQGAENLIKRDHPIILMEYNEVNMQQCYVIKEEIKIFLQDMGYEWKLVTGEDILCTPIRK